jgi:hypothetical protein
MRIDTNGINRLLSSHVATRRLLLATYALLGVPLLLGYVIAPHNNRPEAGDPGPPLDEYRSNRILSDHTLGYVAALHDQLTSPGDSWLKGWNPHIQCGAQQEGLGSTSRAFLIANALCFVLHDAYQVYTCLALATLCLMGLFAYSFAAELDLHPAACYVSAVTLSLGTFCVFWVPQLVHLNSICWTVGLYWLVTAYARRGSRWSLCGIAFCAYALLVTGYPVLIVLFAYTWVPYSLATLVFYGRQPRRVVAMAAGVLGALALGGLAAAPLFLDLVHAARASARWKGVGDSFYLEVLPTFGCWEDVLTFLATSIDPFVLGGPNAMPHPPCANGILLCPLTALLAGIAVAFGRQWTVRFWLFMIVIQYFFNTSSAAHLFAVHHLGLGFSRCRTCWGALVPICVLTAVVVDHVLRNRDARPIWIGFAGSVAALFLLDLGLLYSGADLSGWAVAATAAIALALGFVLRTRSPMGIVALVVITSMAYGGFTILLRPLSTICRRSALTDALHETSDGSCRYACVSPMSALPPNEEGLLGLYSIHSYDSLSSLRFREVVKTWSKSEVVTYGRLFTSLNRGSLADSAETLSLAGVKYLVSQAPLATAWAEPAGQVGKYYLYKSHLPPRMLFQTRAFTPHGHDTATLAADSRAGDLPVRCLANTGDRLRIATVAMETESLLFVSQQHHDYWQARGRLGPLKTVVVNDFYQGVVLPPGTEEIELRFMPWVRWMWIPQAGFVAIAVAFLATSWWKRRHSNSYGTAEE